MKYKVDTKKWKSGNVVYIPAEDQLWVISVVVKTAAIIDYGKRRSAFIYLGSPKDPSIAPERKAILLGKL